MIEIIKEDMIFEMAKLISDYADKDVCGDFGEFIYFSPCLDSHGPRVKFYGGTKETGTTRNAPSLAFTNTGETTLKITDWMNKKNCPNAFNNDYVKKVQEFVQRTLPILLLVWYYKLDEARALKFFEGSISLKKLLSYVTDIEDNILQKIKLCNNLTTLQKVCLGYHVYTF